MYERLQGCWRSLPEDPEAVARKKLLAMGFTEVAAGPLVRSSYRADQVFAGNNLGLGTIPITQIN